MLFVKHGIEVQLVGVVNTPPRFKKKPVSNAVPRIMSTEQTDTETGQHCKAVIGIHVRGGIAELICISDEPGCGSAVESYACIMSEIQFARRIFADHGNIAVINAETGMIRNQRKCANAVGTE